MVHMDTAFIFDLDGTLIDSVYQHVLAWHRALLATGIDLSIWRIHRRIGMSGGLFMRALLREIGRDLDLELTEGSFTAIVGPNGCGKSTLLRALGRLMRPTTGQVLLDGRAIARTPTREVAKVLGLLPQTPVAPDGLTVADLVARGRHPHQSWLRQWSGDDESVVAEALAWTDMAELADRPVDALSGGQRQRAWISMALAQGTDLLDGEPALAGEELRHASLPSHRVPQIRARQPALLEHERDDALRRAAGFVERVVLVLVRLHEHREELEPLVVRRPPLRRRIEQPVDLRHRRAILPRVAQHVRGREVEKSPRRHRHSSPRFIRRSYSACLTT